MDQGPDKLSLPPQVIQQEVTEEYEPGSKSKLSSPYMCHGPYCKYTLRGRGRQSPSLFRTTAHAPQPLLLFTHQKAEQVQGIRPRHRWVQEGRSWEETGMAASGNRVVIQTFVVWGRTYNVSSHPTLGFSPISSQYQK